MGHIIVIRFALVAAAALALTSGAYAQEPGGNAPPPISSLSGADRTAISTILNALATQKGDALSQAVIGALGASGVNAPEVARAVKLAAGANLPNFQSVLVRGCLNASPLYCKLASLQAPSTPGSDIQTSATGSGDGGGAGGGGGGAGGTPQVNQGHNSGSFAGNSLFSSAGLNLSNQNFGSIPASFTPSSTTTNTTPTLTTTLGAPGPIAGTGAPAALTLLGWLVWRRRTKSARQN